MEAPKPTLSQPAPAAAGDSVRGRVALHGTIGHTKQHFGGRQIFRVNGPANACNATQMCRRESPFPASSTLLTAAR